MLLPYRMNKPLSRKSIPVADNGRMNLPAEIRRKLGLKGAGRITIEEFEDSFEIRSFEQRIRRVHEIMEPYLRPGERWSDELIAERRAEAAKEEAEERGGSDG